MRWPGASSVSRLWTQMSRQGVPPWKGTLLVAFVATVVACSAAFAGLRLYGVGPGPDGAQANRPDVADGLPDVMGNRCLNQASRRLERNLTGASP